MHTRLFLARIVMLIGAAAAFCARPCQAARDARELNVDRDVVITVRPLKSAYRVGEPISVDAQIENHGLKKIWVIDDPCLLTFVMAVRIDSVGAQHPVAFNRRYSGYMVRGSGPGWSGGVLKPNKSGIQKVRLDRKGGQLLCGYQFIGDAFQMTAPGLYRFTAYAIAGAIDEKDFRKSRTKTTTFDVVVESTRHP